MRDGHTEYFIEISYFENEEQFYTVKSRVYRCDDWADGVWITNYVAGPYLKRHEAERIMELVLKPYQSMRIARG